MVVVAGMAAVAELAIGCFAGRACSADAAMAVAVAPVVVRWQHPDVRLAMATAEQQSPVAKS